MKGSIQLLGALATVQTVAATGYKWLSPFDGYKGNDGKDYGSRDKYVPVDYSNQYCTTQESTGYDFNDLVEGAFNKYGDHSFQGYTCKQSKLNKRTGRGNKCVSSYVEPENYNNEIKCDKKFSVKEFDVSLEFESVLEFTYGMPDGSNCKHVSSCGTGITSIKNTQCGGAKSVKCKIHKSSKNKKKCGFNIHHIKFHCDTTTTTSSVYVPPTTSEAVSTTSVCTDYTCTATTTTSEAPVTTTSECTDYTCTATTTSSEAATTSSECTDYTCTATTTTSEAVPTTSAPAECTDYTCTATTTSEATTTTSAPAECTDYTCTATTTTSEDVPTTSAPAECTDYTCTAITTTTSEAVPTTSAPAECTDYTCTATTTSEAVPNTSEPAECTDYTCTATTTSEAVPNTSEPAECTDYTCTATTTSEAVPTTSAAAECTDYTCTATASEPAETTATSEYITGTTTPAETVPTYIASTTSSVYVPVETGCPPVLPQCMETWLKITQCINSGDVKCLCPNPDYINSVAQCVESWGIDDDEVSKALEYMQGLCAEHIPENPAIITCVPTYVSIPPATGVASTVTVVTTVVVPYPTTEGEVTTAPGYTPSYTTQTVSTTVTVCPVKLVTTAEAQPVLVPGTYTAPPYVPVVSTAPATVPAQYTTPVYVPTTMMTAYPTGGANTTVPNPPVATGAASSLKVVSSVLAAGLMGVIALIMA